MASFHISSYSMASILVLALLASSVPPTVSTARLLGRSESKTGFQATLTRVDSGGNYTKFELLQRAMGRGRKRVERIHAMVLAAAGGGIESPVHSRDGEFLMELSIGTPPLKYNAILDTGSDLIWTQCKPCTHCFNQPSPIFDPKKSSSFSKLPCTSPLCTGLPRSSCDGHGDCGYTYGYADTFSTRGYMATETFTFENVTVPSIGFGCGLDNEGGGLDQGAGIVGLGRGLVSLVSQLDEPRFSYCLTSIDSTKTSKLLMGSLASDIDPSHDNRTSTPIIKNPSSPSFYYLSLKGITIGDTLLPIKNSAFAIKKDGSGGVIIDSGTTITYLKEEAFELVKKEFISQIKLPVYTGKVGLDLCFTIPKNTQVIEVPTLVFHFEGADLELPVENYFIAASSDIMCLAMGSYGYFSIFGNFQQQNLLVVHDLAKGMMSFVPKQC